MNKSLPIIFVILFWGLFYIGLTYDGTGEIIAIVITLLVVVYLLFSLKGWIKTEVNRIN
jgi:hypothetical protein